MSTYYDYYLAYMKDGKLHPLGPFTRNNELMCVLSKCKSCASELWEDFDPVKEDLLDDMLKNKFMYEDWNGKLSLDGVMYLAAKDLPKEDKLRKGYFLIDDVMRYEKGLFDLSDLFYEWLTPEAYAAKSSNELKFGIPKPRKDCEGNEIDQYIASDYMYYVFEDTDSVGYETSIIRRYIYDTIEFDDEVDFDDVYVIVAIG